MKNSEPSAEVAIVVRLPRELREQLAARAAAEDRSTAALMRIAARRYLASPVDPALRP